ncbi:MAG: MBL fold metallo-hydrolase [Candidatus Pacebacteria bacterium]|nr:MBL fold metallo-hydrolase [Candidatus Paceibacterota bacterium]MBP9772899.1 MBL fold metallo-hydrolase [Candidatus Paceibacterota bacterium]QQR76392.1 MAG: MBL fold metallo-hydrolase [Candidatus Nomurabacteria bacterium]
MIITYYGKQFFKITQGDLVIAYNPISKSSNFSPSRFGSDIAISSVSMGDYSGIETVTYSGKEPFAIRGAGDYEVKGVSIKGVGSEVLIDNKKYINTAYTVTLEGIKLAFIGALTELNDATRELVLSADILFVPVSDKFLPPAKAYKAALSLEPLIIIPMEDASGAPLKQFLKEGGQEDAEIVDKLTIKKKDFDGKEAEIIVLKEA